MFPDLSAALAALQPQPVDFDACIHIAATASIAKELRRSGRQAIQIAHLITMLTEGPGEDAYTYPDWEAFQQVLESEDEGSQRRALRRYESQVSRWERFASGMYMGGSVETMTKLSAYLRRDAQSPESVRRALRKGWIDFAGAIRTLVECGLSPTDLQPTEVIGQTAQRVWQSLEDENPRLARIREQLWIDPNEYNLGTSSRAKSAVSALRTCLDHVFGESNGRIVLQHGYHFFTPPQWAVFRTIEATDWLTQIFLVQDDGSSDVFETWRHYFSENLGFGSVEFPSGQDAARMSPPAEALVAALAGKSVKTTPNPSLRLLKMRNTVSFVQECFPHVDGATDEGDTESELGKPTLFAPDSRALNRLVGRFVDTSQFGEVELSSVPLGIFLVRIHECIKYGPNRAQTVEFSREALFDIVSSGLLPYGSGPYDPLHAGRVFGRILDFFDGCSLGDEWEQRALNLRDILVTRIDPMNVARAGAGTLQELEDKAENFWRLLPWGDLSRADADLVVGLIQTVNSLGKSLIADETISLEEFTKHLQALATRGLATIAEEHREDFEARVKGLRSADTETYATDLADIVKMLVAAPIEFEGSDDGGLVRGFGAIDRFAYVPSESGLHIANLSDLSFPRQSATLGWPFRLVDVCPNSAPKETAVQLLELRAQTAPLSDIYLLWVGLNSVRGTDIATISYIEKLDREELRPSPLMTLLADASAGIKDPAHAKAVAAAAGGVAIQSISDSKTMDRLPLPKPLQTQSTSTDLTAAIKQLPHQVVASSILCERRFALQWMTGSSAAFTKPHMQSILFGNLPAAIRARHGLSIDDSLALCDDLFRHLTEGQRLSSRTNRRIIEQGSPNANISASWHWLFTIGMTAKSDDNTYGKLKELREKIIREQREPNRSEVADIAAERSSRAYRAARKGGEERTEASALAAEVSQTFLPSAENGPLGVTAKQCNNCPVSDRCLESRKNS